MARELSEWGKQCKVQMLLLGKSLSDIADDTGYSRTYISAIINGRVNVPEETIKKISVALGINSILAEHM